MKRKCTWITALLASAILTQCSKDKKETPAPDLQKDLRAYFRLNGDFGDSTKNIQNASYGGILISSKDRNGYNSRAMYFGGGLFSFGTDGWPATSITISLWIKPKDLTIDSYLISSNEGAFGVYQSKSKLGLAISIPATESALAEIGTEWTHFAGTYDGKDIKTYINGKLTTTFHHPGVPDVTTMINVGAKDVPEWMGTLDDIRFYNRVLNAQEIAMLANL